MNPPSLYQKYRSLLPAFLAGVILTALLISVGFVLGRHSAAVNVQGAYSDEGSNAIVNAVKLAAPSVVNVDTTMAGLPAKPSSLLPGMPREEVPSQPRDGKGTGVIFDAANGLMLTNAHVITDPQTGQTAQHIQVNTRDGRQFTGQLLGEDRFSDIAVVKLSPGHLQQAKMAQFDNVEQLAVGQWVIAIGNPYSEENTVTVGVISAVGRTIPVPVRAGAEPFSLTGMIQTDAAINPGNSGGPLCNLKGEVIGINTAIIPWATGLGFSIPINQAMRVARQIVANGRVQHPYIGVMITALNASLRKKYGLKNTLGAFVQSVQDASPAKNAGIQADDIILEIDGQKIIGSEDVLNAIANKRVGDTMQITVMRQGKTLHLPLKVGDRPQN